MPFYDAHNHLQQEELTHLDLTDYWNCIEKVVVNGTHPRDWEQVARLAEAQPEKVIPSFGVHPWKVKDLPADWLEQLAGFLEKHPQAGVGEIGLDKWVKNDDLPLQKTVFEAQLRLAKQTARPVTVHCLQAWGSLKESLLPYAGELRILLHAFNGSAEMAREFIEMGAYFSFSPYFLHDRKERVREIYRSIPLERILIETDTPAMLGPPSTWSTEQKSFSDAHQHPGNLIPAYAEAGKVLGLPLKEFQDQVEANFSAWLSSPR